LVRITLTGLEAEERYGIIHDELPSGLVPINQFFKNEQYVQDNGSDYRHNYSLSGEVTENGVILSLYQVSPDQTEYTYRARVVNEGVFFVPPASASLMYAPEIYGRSDAQIISIGAESFLIPNGDIQVQKARGFIMSRPIVTVGLLTIVLGGIGVLVLKKRGMNWARLVELINQKKQSK